MHVQRGDGRGARPVALQTVLPGLLLAEGESNLILEGGTHNPFAPPLDFLTKTYLPHAVYQWQIGLGQEIQRRGETGWCVPPSRIKFDSPSASSSPGNTVCSTRVCAACRAHAERVLALCNSAGAKLQPRGADRGSCDFGMADLCGGVDGREVLPHQSRLLPPGTDIFDDKRSTGDQRHRQRGAEDLPAAFAVRAVDGENGSCHVETICGRTEARSGLGCVGQVAQPRAAVLRPQSQFCTAEGGCATTTIAILHSRGRLCYIGCTRSGVAQTGQKTRSPAGIAVRVFRRRAMRQRGCAAGSNSWLTVPESRHQLESLAKPAGAASGRSFLVVGKR